MNILILGATGFIGSAVVLRLSANGHAVTGLGRNLAAARRRMPDIAWVEGDLRNFCQPQDWTALLAGIYAVVNCAGALQDTPRDDVAAVQDRAMRALQYHRLYSIWFACGFPAFMAVLAILWLMLAMPSINL